MSSTNTGVGRAREHTPEAPAPSEIPLLVDLDGTLIKSDTLVEGAWALLKTNPLYLFSMAIWLCHGKAHLKRQIAQRTPSEVLASLPYHSEFVAYLESQHSAGRPLILATGADETIARRIVSRLGYFDQVIASDGKVNVKGPLKLQALQQHLAGKPFVYAGNSRDDIPAWRQASEVVLVNASTSVGDTLRKERIAIHRVFEDRPSRLRSLVQAIRVHQLPKNLLVFVPLLTAHKLSQAVTLAHCVAAFVAFSLAASSAYVLNDLLDLQNDRLHHTKRFRPFASGNLPIGFGLVLVPCLLATSLFIGLASSRSFFYLLILYLAIAAIYSLSLKGIVVVDVMILAALYTLRIIAGGAATSIRISFWLLGFSVFLFLSLAFAKRFVELNALSQLSKSKTEGRAYLTDDLETVARLGTSSGYLASLVLALYLQSAEVRALYARPEWLWGICLLVIYWVSRVWLLANRGQLHGDPIVFALKDKTTYVLGVLTVFMMLLAA